jgi:hypothetical protein
VKKLEPFVKALGCGQIWEQQDSGSNSPSLGHANNSREKSLRITERGASFGRMKSWPQSSIPKLQTVSALFVALVLLCGCSTPAFTEYNGSEVFQGTGGEEQNIDGIEFWENGEPARKYRILGVLAEGHDNYRPGDFSNFFHSDRDSAVAKAAREHGGDAVVFVDKDQGTPNTGQLGSEQHRRFTLVVVKYVE